MRQAAVRCPGGAHTPAGRPARTRAEEDLLHGAAACPASPVQGGQDVLDVPHGRGLGRRHQPRQAVQVRAADQQGLPAPSCWPRRRMRAADQQSLPVLRRSWPRWQRHAAPAIHAWPQMLDPDDGSPAEARRPGSCAQGSHRLICAAQAPTPRLCQDCGDQPADLVFGTCLQSLRQALASQKAPAGGDVLSPPRSCAGRGHAREDHH